jgi:hypothetical protein
MNVVSVLHKKAMEFADEALLARMEGNEEASSQFFAKAFELEKEAAFSVEEDSDTKDSRYILIRSAASLALNCGQLQEAEWLIEKGLAGNPPAFIRKELLELDLQLKQQQHDKVDFFEMVGVITSADADNNEIRIQESISRRIYTIAVPMGLINDIVRSYWADLVQVKAQKVDSGVMILSQISKAA